MSTRKPKPPSDLWKALADVEAELASHPPMPRPPGAFTLSEYATQRGVSSPTAQTALRRLAAAGKIERIRFSQQRPDGAWVVRGGYRLAGQQ